ncbi:MAG: VTT domain-containing protein [Nanoarchaeota archaeon]|nr:VTT domain-containing protein [Nanoarchaeota archaeon]
MKGEIKDKIKNNVVEKTFENRYFVFGIIIFILLISYSYLFKGFIYDLVNSDIDGIISMVNSFGGLSMLIFVAIVIIEVVIAPIPGMIFNVAGGITFGPFLGAVLSIIGNVIGATICYFLARNLGGHYIEKLIDEKRLRFFYKYTHKHGYWVLFLLRLNPVTSSDIFSYFAGLINMKYRDFILGTTLGLIPLMFVLSYFGDYFIKDSPLFTLFFLILAALYFLVFFYGIYKIGKAKVKDKIKKLNRNKL